MNNRRRLVAVLVVVAATVALTVTAFANVPPTAIGPEGADGYQPIFMVDPGGEVTIVAADETDDLLDAGWNWPTPEQHAQVTQKLIEGSSYYKVKGTSGGGGGGGGALSAGSGEAPAGVQDDTLGCLTDSAIEAIRTEPTTIEDAWAACADQLRLDLGPDFAAIPDDGLLLVFTSLVAYRMAPYGAAVGLTLPDLLAMEQMDCDNYVSLAFQLYEMAGGTAPVHFVGWEGGAIGNHAQMFVSGDGWSLLVDPTIALAAATDFDTVAAGKPVSAVVEFATREEIPEFRAAVKQAVTEGRYRPSDLLYYFVDHDEWADPPPVDTWPTPAAQG